MNTIERKPICIFSTNYIDKVQDSIRLTEHICSMNEKNKIGNAFIFLNGFISNLEEIRRKFDLTSVDQYTIISQLFEKVGKDITSHLEGTYALVIVMGEEIIFFRDRNSIENLFYYFDKSDNSFIISTHIKEIIKFIDLYVNTAILPKYFLMSQIGIGESFYKNIKSPRRYEIINYNASSGEWHSAEYDNYAYLPMNLETRLDRIEDNVEDIIRRYCKNLQASYPSCVMVNTLSGGVDSSYLQVVLKDMGFNEAYTSSYPLPQGATVHRYSTDISDHLGSEHRMVIVPPSDIITLMRRGIEITELPYMFEGECMGIPMEEKISQDHLESNSVLMLSGDGSDAAFGAGRVMIELRYLSVFKVWKLMGLPLSVMKILKSNNYRRYQALMHFMKRQELDGKFLVNMFAQRPVYEKIVEGFDIKDIDSCFTYEIESFKRFDVDILEKLHRFKVFDYELNREIKAIYLIAKNEGICAVQPFQNEEFLRYIINVPLRKKVKGLTTKHHMRKIMMRYVPKEFVFREKKKNQQHDKTSLMGLIFDDDEKLNEFVKEMKSSGYDKYFKFDYDLIFKNEEYEFLAMKLLNFHIWHQAFIKKAICFDQ